ncbi:S49 family peptidase [Leptospira bandrabouensis]|uniref:S49 family peptidase n=1 Tax=Leptospira bandrabouensis TaxID=2484903 RepID=UPI00223DDB13|nr:S49 family peptidase [Leptospira bandrabouensis]MCW7458923.1 S49 family peptidase [Leptospira bandrabouensis]MCW7477991.1 S49 family peptidase [Leptospira bandrabouensis]MCW7485887.1 S49 family peptidase [Leptospira bandrabouensis]
MFRILFFIIFLPFRLLYQIYLRLSLIFQSGREVFELEFPAVFEDSYKSYFVKKLQGKEETVTRLELLILLKLIQKNGKIKTLDIFLPPLEWTLSEFYEVRNQILSIKESGKIVRIFAKEGGVGTLLLLTAATEKYLAPESEFMVLLPSAEPMFFGKFLKTWGIEVQAFASGPYKSFAESFTRGEFSKEAKKNLETLILDLRKVLLSALTNGEKSLESLFYKPMLSADELLSAGVITGIKSENEFFSEDRKLFSANYPNLHHSIKEFKILPKRKAEVVILPLEGGITGGDYLHKNRENGKIEAFSLIPNLKALAEDKKIKAVILEISSPGGSAFYSEQIHQEIMELKKTKIVTAYFKDTVASGGYYLGSAVDHITASPVCITGSIGAVSIRANLQKLYKKFQLNKEAVGFYPFRDIHSEFQPLSKQSVQYLESQIKKIEGLFYRRVSEGRKIPLEEMPKIGMGRVYLPTVENRIVDSLGGLLDAVHEVKERLGGKPIILTEELPAYNLKNKIPILGGLMAELKFLESFNEVSLLSPVRLAWKNRK